MPTRPPKRNPLDALSARLGQPPATTESVPPAPAATVTYHPAQTQRSLVDARVKAIGLDELWLEHQPREIVPEEQLQRLIAEDRAQPKALLEILDWAAAADAYYADVRDALQALAASIRSEGVLQPIEVLGRHGRYVIRDGHRRSLAAHLAGLDRVPAIQVAEPSELEEVAHALIVNVQRQDLTAIEKGAALLRLALLVGRRMATDADGDTAATDISIATLIGDSATDRDGDGDTSTTITGFSRSMAADIRERVCAMVGLKRDMYYAYLALNRLTPQAKALGRRLGEKQLRPIAKAPASLQAELVSAAIQRGLTATETASLVRLAREGERDEITAMLDRLRQRPGVRTRPATSWHALLAAVPHDYPARLDSLRAELTALPERMRQARLDDIAQQVQRLDGLRQQFQVILAEHRPATTAANAPTGE